jgi:hypothetical protein
MVGEHIGIFGQIKLWDLAVPSTFCHPSIFKDVEEILSQEEEERQALNRLKSTKSDPSIDKKTTRNQKTYNDTNAKPIDQPNQKKQDPSSTRLKTADLLSSSVNTWYGNTIFARELILEKIPRKRMPQGAKSISMASKEKGQGVLRLYQYLEPYELVNVQLPSIKIKNSTENS